MDNRRLTFTWIDWLLVAAVAGLSLHVAIMVLWPVWEGWKNRPRPGIQVPQLHLAEHRSGENTVTVAVNYLLYLPLDYTSQKKWPLVVYLHGAGSRGRDLELVRHEWLPDQITQSKQFDFILASPQCPPNSRWSPEMVASLAEHISNSLSVDRDRVYLTGYSLGGSGTWAAAAYDPERFAAIAPLCGGGNLEQAEQLKNIPIWAFHGDKDDVVLIRWHQEMVDAVKDCGGHVKFTVYPGVGHGIAEMTYQNEHFFEWLLAQRRNTQPVRAEP